MEPEHAALSLAAYDRRAVHALLRDVTPRALLTELRAGRMGARLTPDQRAELAELLTAWERRALGALPLRDALLVDERRGRRVFALLCVEHTTARITLPPALAAELPAPPIDLPDPPALVGQVPEAAPLVEAAARGLSVALQNHPDAYPLPNDLERLLPTLPPAIGSSGEPFVQPTGTRRRIAAALATAGVALLALPMLAGRIPQHPAGLPLALLTLALLLGIRAGWPGYAGSLCIWLVANLPGFRHGTDLAAFWPALPLLIAGLLLLSLDRHVRAMWRWLRALLTRGRRPHRS